VELEVEVDLVVELVELVVEDKVHQEVLVPLKFQVLELLTLGVEAEDILIIQWAQLEVQV
jgi:hypothetical protein